MIGLPPPLSPPFPLRSKDGGRGGWCCTSILTVARLLPITKTIVADAFFSKETFVRPLVKEEFNVVSRLRNDAVLFYPTTESPTGKRGRPKLYDGKVDFANLDTSRCEEIPVDNGRLFGLRAYSKSLKGRLRKNNSMVSS